MTSLQEMLEEEGKRNNELQRILQEGSFPSPEMIKQIGSEELFRLAAQSDEFQFKLRLGILMSNYHMIKLMGVYVSNPDWENQGDLDKEALRKLIGDYRAQSNQIMDSLLKMSKAGYEDGW